MPKKPTGPPVFKLRTYNGKVKCRADVEEILHHLPRKAKIHFAYLKRRSVPLPYGPNAQADDLLCFWQFDQKFYACHANRILMPNEYSGEVEVGPWTIPQESRINPKTFLTGLLDERIKWPDAWNTMKDALRELCVKMVQIEKDWAVEPEENDVVLASERFAARRN